MDDDEADQRRTTTLLGVVVVLLFLVNALYLVQHLQATNRFRFIDASSEGVVIPQFEPP